MSPRCLWCPIVSLLSTGLLLGSSIAYAQGIRLAEVPKIALGSEAPVTKAEGDEIRGLIRSLAAIDKPSFGHSSTYSGSSFAPIDGAGTMGTMILMRHEVEPSESVRRLVELGTKALPFLLEAMTDATPTKLKIELPFKGHFGAMWFGQEVYPNHLNRHEASVLADLSSERKVDIEESLFSMREYTLTVGDICFVAIGQITNRNYAASRYQPTACVVINSPVQDNKLAEVVRAIWKTDDHRQKLLDSLLIDFCSHGDDEFQVGAALRLLYYFPRETASLIVKRLKSLDVTTEDYGKRMDANGIRAEDLVNAIAWCPVPAVRTQLVAIMEKTTDVDTLISCLRAVDAEHDNVVFARLTALLDQLPCEERGPYGDGYKLLLRIGERFPNKAKLVFEEYIEFETVQRQRSLSLVLRATRCELAPQLLPPFLDVKTEFGWSYAVHPGANDPRLPIRVCDEAAETLAACDPRLTFTMAGTHEDLDRQIADIKHELLRKRP